MSRELTGGGGDIPPAGVRIEAAARRLRAALGADVVFHGSYRGGGATLVIDGVDGGRTGALSGLAIRRGSGVAGQAVALSRPFAVSDYARAATITHQYDAVVATEGLRAVLAVPITRRGQAVGVLYGAFRAPVGVGDRALAVAARVAREAEHQLGVDAEVGRRLGELERDRAAATAPGPETAAVQRLREIRAELLEIAAVTTDPAVRERLRALSHTAPDEAPAPTLSAREIDVLVQAAVGCTNAEIAVRLTILPTTVKSYLRSAMRKLGARNRVEAVGAARRLGLIG